jgi:hypothetical protein
MKWHILPNRAVSIPIYVGSSFRDIRLDKLNVEPLPVFCLGGASLKFKLKFNQKTGGAFW